MHSNQAADATLEQRILRDIGHMGFFLRCHVGGRGGKKPLLVILLNNDGHLTQRELLESSAISSGALSEVLTKLEGEGLLTRTPLATDRRQQEITLTEEGRARAAQIEQQRQAFEAKALEVLDADEKDQLLQTLDRLIDHWERLDKEVDAHE